MKRVVFITSIILLITINSYSQEIEGKRKNNELCVGFGVSHDLEATGLHLQYIRSYTDKIGFGIGGETIFDEHTHYSTGVVFQYNVFSNLVLSISPGICINNGIYFSTHLEAGYDFEIKDFHFGPAIEIGHSVLETHYMFGVHSGISF